MRITIMNYPDDIRQYDNNVNSPLYEGIQYCQTCGECEYTCVCEYDDEPSEGFFYEV